MLPKQPVEGRLLNNGLRMAQYRCYFLDPQNHITSWRMIDLTTDNLAQTEADRLWKIGPSHAVEVWKGTQMIHRDVRAVI
jgi:hypothetical protein